jgi:hypothetical protein
LRIDWADACSLACNGERYFLLVVDKDTEYLANFNTKSRHNPVDLLRAYINTTGKRPRYLRYNRLCAQEELFNHVITRSQSQAAERAKQNDLILSSTPQQADDKHSSRKGAKPALASKPISAAKDCIVIPMSEMLELSLTHAFVTHKYPVTLPVHFNPAGMPTPKGDTIVIAVKAQKQTREKKGHSMGGFSFASFTRRQADSTISKKPRTEEWTCTRGRF